MTINIHIHDHRSVNETLQEIHRLLIINNKTQRIMAQELENLKKEVAEQTEVTQSAITLIQGLKTRLDEAIASGDPAELTKLSADLDASQQALAQAITANTPAATPNDGTTPE